MDEFPPLVRQAYDLAQSIGFPASREEAAEGVASASLPGVGRFLAMREFFFGDPRLGS